MNNAILLLMPFLMMRGKGRRPLSLPSVNMAFDLDVRHTKEKIKMIRKIGPYFPEEYIPSINKALIITEKILKLYEAIEFLQEKDSLYIKEAVPVKSHQERLSYIANTLQKDFSREEIDRLGSIADIILQADRFNKMAHMLNHLTSNPDMLKDPNSIFKVLEPLLQGKDEKEMKKMKDMVKMMDIMKALDKPKKEDKKEAEKEEKNL